MANKEEYVKEIQYICLIMTEEYIKNNYQDIIKYENIIQQRKQQESIDIENLIEENKYNLNMCEKYKNRYILINDKYDIKLDI